MEHTVIVGGTRGIGHAAARQLFQAGYRVAITGLATASAERAAASLGAQGVGVALDLKERSRLSEALRALGPIDHLVLAACGDIAWGAFAVR
jgi:NAD(P)-dependent dehydrogenase (short-subunit alcohol dehydrogenase family)